MVLAEKALINKSLAGGQNRQKLVDSARLTDDRFCVGSW
jgi:hypothetical protein